MLCSSRSRYAIIISAAVSGALNLLPLWQSRTAAEYDDRAVETNIYKPKKNICGSNHTELRMKKQNRREETEWE